MKVHIVQNKSPILTQIDRFWNVTPVKAPVTQNSTSKSRTRSHETLVDVVISGNFWSVLAWTCFVRGMAVGGCSPAEALPKHGKIHLSGISCLTHAISRDTNA